MSTARALAVIGLLLAGPPAWAQTGQPPAYRLEVVEHRMPPALSRSEQALVALTVRNAGTETWRRAEPIGVSYHWVDAAGAPHVFEGLRTRLPRDVEPGHEVSICATVLAPDASGRYQLLWDAVYEGRFWFSHRGGIDAWPVSVEVGLRTPKPRVGRLPSIAAFWALTLAPVLVTAAWLHRRRATDIPSWDDYAFDVSLLGFGLLFAVLHTLVFTVGLSLIGVAAGLLLTYAAVAVWLRAPRRRRERTPTTATALPIAARLSAADIAGISVVLVLLLQWLWQASASAEVAGTDAAHYHVPHAVNFLRGLRPTQYTATPHLYPMSTSIWAAWFMLPFDGPLLVDLATLPAFVLLVTSAGLIFRIVTGHSGLSWVPWLVLVAFSGFLPRLSLLMSADLSYAAAALAVTAVVLRLWRDRALDGRTVASMGLAVGWLLGAKSTGLLSLGVLGAAAVLLFGFSRIRDGRRVEGFRPELGLLFVILAVVSGGIWLLRNWWAFGSPVAPYGVNLIGLQLFAGPPTSNFREYLSVIGDLKRPDYSLWPRLGTAIEEMFGSWTAWIPGALAILLVDGLVQVRRGSLSQTTGRKAAFMVAVLVAFVVHGYVIAGLPWTSLEWTRNLSLRYLLPFYFLFLLVAFTLLFIDVVPWHASRIGRAIVWTLIAGGALWHTATHTDIGNLPRTAWLLVVDRPTVAAGAALAVVLLAYCYAARRFDIPHRTGVGLVTLGLIAALTWHEAADAATVEAAQRRLASAESSCVAMGVPAAWEHRGLYLEALAYQRSAGLTCDRTRFFLASRFDRPLDLQDASFRNEVVDLSVTPGGLAGKRVPGPGGCDMVVLRRSEAPNGESAVFDSLFGRHYTFTRVATYGRYDAYVRP